MKLYKKIMGIFLSAAMAISMVACSSNTTENKEDTVAATPEEILQEAETKMQEITSVESEMNMEMAMNMSGEEFSIKTNSVITSFTEPLKLKMEMTMDMGELGSQNMNLYVAEENEKRMMYANIGGNWVKQEIPQEELEAYNTQQSMVTYLDGATGLKEAGKEEVNGAEATKYEGVIAKDALADIMKSVNATENLEAMLAGTDMTSEELYEGLSDVKIAVWIDTEGYPVKYEMDMTEMMQGFMQKVVQMSGLSEQEAQTLNISTTKFSIVNKNFNHATDFELPEEAKSATEVAA